MSPFSLRLLAAALVGLAVSPLAAQTLSHAVPGAVAPGRTTEITLHGAKLAGAARIWTSFPAQVEITSDRKEDAKVVCKLTLASGVPVGIGGVVVATPAGLTDVLYLMVDDLPSVADNGNNHATAAPQDVTLPTAIDGACDGTLFDYYRITAKAGQRMSCEVVAARLGWDFDAIVRVLDATGRELLVADDDPASGADPRFVFTAPADGPYVFEIGDNRYKPAGRYRLRLGDFPLVSTPQPLVVTGGAVTPVVIGDAAPLTVLAPAAAAGQSLPLAASGPQGAGWTSLAVSELPVVAESAASSPAALPAIFAGTLAQPGEQDAFGFHAEKGAALACRAITRSAGSAAIVKLRLLNSAGKQLAESAVTDADEPALAFTAPEAGDYQLTVSELAGRGGADYSYAVEVRTGPQFALTLKNDKNNRIKHAVPPGGGALALDVQCQRAGYDGPIRLAVDSPRSGWQVFNSTIPAKANEVKCYIVAPADWTAGEVAPLRIVGTAEGANDSAMMATTVQLRTVRPQTPYPPAWLDGAVFVSATAAKKPFYSVSSAKYEVALPKQVGQAKLTLDFARLDDKFKDVPLTVLPLGLPAGVTVEVKRNGNGPKETYDLTFKGPKDLAEGQHAVRYFAFAEYANSGRAVVSGDIRLDVVNEAPPAPEVKAP